MKVVGIVAEYNPFHNGHAYHIKKAKEMTGADYCIVVMSGDFVQRGAPAIMDKYSRSLSALTCGADIVIELPVRFATASAELFAYGAISLLASLGITDCICFGSECGNAELLQDIAHVLVCEPVIYRQVLKEQLKSGLSFPAAREKALISYFSQKKLPYSEELIHSTCSSPNNILGIEYCKAIEKLKLPMEVFTFCRAENQYHDETLSSNISSATSIRRVLEQQQLSLLQQQVPPSVYTIMTESHGHTFPIFYNDCSSILHYKLLSECEHLQDYAGISDSLRNRMKNKLPYFASAEQFTELLKTKEVTYTSICRALLHILLDIKGNIALDTKQYYIRVLGFRTTAASLLTAVKKNSSIPLLGKIADAENTLSSDAKPFFEHDIYASHIYQSLITSKFHSSFQHEYTRSILRV